jgi:hypothetical protein
MPIREPLGIPSNGADVRNSPGAQDGKGTLTARLKCVSKPIMRQGVKPKYERRKLERIATGRRERLGRMPRVVSALEVWQCGKKREENSLRSGNF